MFFLGAMSNISLKRMRISQILDLSVLLIHFDFSPFPFPFLFFSLSFLAIFYLLLPFYPLEKVWFLKPLKKRGNETLINYEGNGLFYQKVSRQ